MTEKDVIDLLKEAPYFLSLMISFLGTVLFLIPTLVAWLLAKRFISNWQFTISGLVFGCFAFSLTIWLYFQMMLDPIRALIFFIPGTTMMVIHFLPLVKLSLLDTINETEKLTGTYNLFFTKATVVGGIFWATAYGLLGFAFDRNRIASKRRDDINSSNNRLE